MPPQAPLIPAATVYDTGYIHDLTGTTQAIENSHIVPNTQNTYNSSLTALSTGLISKVI